MHLYKHGPIHTPAESCRVFFSNSSRIPGWLLMRAMIAASMSGSETYKAPTKNIQNCAINHWWLVATCCLLHLIAKSSKNFSKARTFCFSSAGLVTIFYVKSRVVAPATRMDEWFVDQQPPGRWWSHGPSWQDSEPGHQHEKSCFSRGMIPS